MPDVLRVQGPRLVDVARSLDDGPPVGEDGELVALGGELQHETVEADRVAHLAEVPRHLLEVQFRRQPMGDLYGIAATQARRLRALFAVEPFESAPAAAGTVHLAQKRGDLDPAGDILPDVDVDQVAVNLVELAGEDLERFGRLEAGDDADDRPEHAGRLAGAGLARRGGRLEDAAQARRLAGQDRHRLAMTADRAAVDPRFF